MAIICPKNAQKSCNAVSIRFLGTIKGCTFYRWWLIIVYIYIQIDREFICQHFELCFMLLFKKLNVSLTNFQIVWYVTEKQEILTFHFRYPQNKNLIPFKAPYMVKMDPRFIPHKTKLKFWIMICKLKLLTHLNNPIFKSVTSVPLWHHTEYILSRESSTMCLYYITHMTSSPTFISIKVCILLSFCFLAT